MRGSGCELVLHCDEFRRLAEHLSEKSQRHADRVRGRLVHLSQHLAVLRRHHLVVGERRGSQVFYSLAYPQVADLLAVSRSLLIEILQTTRQQLESTVTS